MVDFSRYSRLEAVKEIGRQGVEKLAGSKVLVIGAGALGSLCAMYLAASGVGEITVADFDTVDLSNLQRQLFFTEELAGKSKVLELAERMRSLNSDIVVHTINSLIRRDYAESHFGDFDFIVDGSDNPSTKAIVDEYCFRSDVPCVIAGVNGFKGQVMSWKPGSVRFSSIFGDGAVCSGELPCGIAGVVGPTAGVVASVQAAECIKYLTDSGDCLFNKVMFFNLASCEFRVLDID
ncbi:MAG: HesA/MoeB/ThiF family protein [Bacteroidales bacterium]|nr:HesA/MoeB/ThiF family protein [Bacteroidales bacterium]